MYILLYAGVSSMLKNIVHTDFFLGLKLICKVLSENYIYIKPPRLLKKMLT